MSISPKDRFGRLVVISLAGTRNSYKEWLCLCDCGNKTLVISKHLSSGGTKSCGCYRSENSKRMRTESTIPFESRLLKKENGCWEWQGSRDRKGYGTLRRGNTDIKAHRFAYEEEHGPIDPNILVCHTCDNPPCCNPSHLFLGTVVENIADRTTKGRSAKGENNGYSKLNNHSVSRIRALSLDGRTQQEIADIFGITQSAVSKVLLGKVWAHIK